MKNRMLRVRELVQQELGCIIQKDMEFPGVLVAINSLDVTPDLRHAHAYIGVIGNETQQEAVIRKLEDKRGHLQKRLAARIQLKQTPQLHFKIDHSIERGVRVTSIMTEIDAQIGKDAWKELLPEDERD